MESSVIGVTNERIWLGVVSGGGGGGGDVIRGLFVVWDQLL